MARIIPLNTMKEKEKTTFAAASIGGVLFF
jgi:hypothetical protein